MLCTIQNIKQTFKNYLQEINWITNAQYQYIVDEQNKQLMDIQEALQRTLKTAQAPSLNDRCWQTIPVPYDSVGKEYLYGLHFAGLTYSLYGWLARVELHLVNSKRSSKLSLFMPKTILQHSTKERNNLRVSSVGHFSFLKRSSYSISPRFCPRASREALRCEALKTSQPQGCALTAPSGL